MDELGEALQRLLNDPAQMAAMRSLAGELLGGQSAPHAAPEPPAAEPSSKAELVRALSPWLKPERAKKLQRVLRMAQTARMASAVWRRMGG